MFIDSHCHPYLAKDKSLSENLSQFQTQGGEALISIGVDYETSVQCIELANKHAFTYAAIGVHPCHIGFDGGSIKHHLDVLKTTDQEKECVGIFEEMYKSHSQQVVAIGECGLDYHWLADLAKKEKAAEEDIKLLQQYYFKFQIRLAEKLGLPFIIHNRKSGDDVYRILKDCNYGKFALHSFTENLEYAHKCIHDFPECMISFSGILTFKNATEIQEVAQKIPLSRIMIETDSPYLTPTPYRGKTENEPSYTKFVLQKIQELRPEDNTIIQETILNNTKKFFKI